MEIPPSVPPVLAPAPLTPAQLDEENRYRKGTWLVQFGEAIFAVILGLSMERFANTGVFSVKAEWTPGFFFLVGPLLLLYAWALVYLIMYWYAMRMAAPVMVKLNRVDLGVKEFVLVVVLGFIFYQIFYAVTPDLVAPPVTVGTVSDSLDMAMWLFGVLIIFDMTVVFIGVVPRLRLVSNGQQSGDRDGNASAVVTHFKWRHPVKAVLHLVIYVFCFCPCGLLYPSRFVPDTFQPEGAIWVTVVGYVLMHILAESSFYWWRKNRRDASPAEPQSASESAAGSTAPPSPS